ncbi:MAG TPA: aldo/keto reductase [Drouetiella sp.]
MIASCKAQEKFSPLKYRDFGKTGLKVSEVGFGAWAIGGNEHGNSYGPTDDKVSVDAIHRAIDLGCNFFDTADVYGWGHSEELLGKAIKGKRDHLIIATKVGSDFYQGAGFQTFTPDYVRYAFEKSLARLKTDYIDVYQLHNPPLRILKRPETFEVLQELKKEGKIRAWGVSIFDPIEGLTALKTAQPDSIQVSFNLFNIKPAEELFPRANEVGCAIVVREALANGFLTGKYEPNSTFEHGDIRHNWPKDYILARILATQRLKFLVRGNRSMPQSALRFVLQNQQVAVALAGAKSPEQVEENLKASEAIPLASEELREIHALQKKGFQK